MKYIVVEAERRGDTIKVPFVFPNGVMHVDFARYAEGMLRQVYGYTTKVISAGTYDRETGKCHGLSSSLMLKSHVGDDELIRMCDYTLIL